MNLIDVLKAYAKKLADDGQNVRKQIKELRWISDSAQQEYIKLRLTIAPNGEEQLEMARNVGLPLRAYRRTLLRPHTSSEREALWLEKRAIGKKSRCTQLAIKMISGHSYSEFEESRHKYNFPDARMILSIVHACAEKSEEYKLIKKYWTLKGVKEWLSRNEWERCRYMSGPIDFDNMIIGDPSVSQTSEQTK